MKLDFSDDAIADIRNLHSYIARDSERAARRVVARIRSAASQLKSHPYLGKSIHVTNTREWLVRGLPYVIVYRVDQKPPRIVIARIFHTSQDRPGSRGTM